MIRNFKHRFECESTVLNLRVHTTVWEYFDYLLLIRNISIGSGNFIILYQLFKVKGPNNPIRTMDSSKPNSRAFIMRHKRS